MWSSSYITFTHMQISSCCSAGIFYYKLWANEVLEIYLPYIRRSWISKVSSVFWYMRDLILFSILLVCSCIYLTWLCNVAQCLELCFVCTFLKHSKLLCDSSFCWIFISQGISFVSIYFCLWLGAWFTVESNGKLFIFIFWCWFTTFYGVN